MRLLLRSSVISPKAYAASSATIGDADLSSFTNFGTASYFRTFFNCTDDVFENTINNPILSTCKEMLHRNKEISYTYIYIFINGKKLLCYINHFFQSSYTYLSSLSKNLIQSGTMLPSMASIMSFIGGSLFLLNNFLQV
jgi:hypothetical protein